MAYLAAKKEHAAHTQGLEKKALGAVGAVR